MAPLPSSSSSRLVPALAWALVAVAAAEPGVSQEVTAEATYTAEWMAVASGGAERGDALLGNLDLTLEVRDEERGLTLFGYLLANHGGEPSRLAGDAQGVSNIEAPEALRLFEAWVEKETADRRLSFLLGLWDLNSEFDVIPSGGVFVNSSFGIGPDFSQSGLAGPSIFPVTALALRTRWSPGPGAYLQGAVLDAVAGDPSDPRATTVRLSSDEGALLALEGGWRPRLGAGADAGRGKVALGLWYYTRASAASEGGGAPRSRPGVYGLAEAPLDRGPVARRELHAFARAGWADPRVHRFGAYTGAGAVYRGLLPGRSSDRLGIGVAVAWAARPFRDALAADGHPPTRTETVVELTYRLEAGRWAIQPDVQWVVNPDTRASTSDGWVVGLRLSAGAEWRRGG